MVCLRMLVLSHQIFESGEWIGSWLRIPLLKFVFKVIFMCSTWVFLQPNQINVTYNFKPSGVIAPHLFRIWDCFYEHRKQLLLQKVIKLVVVRHLWLILAIAVYSKHHIPSCSSICLVKVYHKPLTYNKFEFCFGVSKRIVTAGPASCSAIYFDHTVVPPNVNLFHPWLWKYYPNFASPSPDCSVTFHHE